MSAGVYLTIALYSHSSLWAAHGHSGQGNLARIYVAQYGMPLCKRPNMGVATVYLKMLVAWLYC